LDDIAWLINTRGRDIPYNPVFLSFLWVDDTQAVLFSSPPADVETQAVLNQLKTEGLTLQPYEAVWSYLPELAQNKTVYWIPNANSAEIEQTLNASLQCFLQTGGNFIQAEKAIKTPEEQAGMREANIRSSVAVIRTLAWLDSQSQAGKAVSEKELAQKIEACYVEEGAIDLSFNTIAGIGANTAIIHYSTPSENASAGDWILLDSGAQYPFGTTDITRTTTFGQHCPTPEHMRAYTHVLKSHIAGASAVFPKGTSGAQIDGIVRQPMWQAGYDFGHGTGHGVGCFLNVHEGPFGIAKGYAAPLPQGMVVSIEPGYYVQDWGGIRLENLALATEAQGLAIQQGTPQCHWLSFEILNLIPFARHLVDVEALSSSEKTWLQGYEARIREIIVPRLLGKDSATATWLESQWIIPSTD
jgi:Xaa-Pro aminopeptidase